jgi:hypothetical protein
LFFTVCLPQSHTLPPTSLSSFYPLAMISQENLHALIDETEALGFDFPVLDSIDESPPNQTTFALIGKLLSLKPLNTQTVRATLVAAWSFAAPLTVEFLAPNKFLLGVSTPDHVDRILHRGPWNIRGSLLLLQQWSPELAIAEVELTKCAFWIQVHGLPRQNMTVRNAIRIGKAIGSLLEVENSETSGLICRSFLHVKVELNTARPLPPGFNLPRQGKEPLWISFRYERLGAYCNFCGLLGHKKLNCPAPSQVFTQFQYSIPLQAIPSSDPRTSSPGTRVDSNSGLWSEGSTHFRSADNSSFNHGGESTPLLIVPRVSQTDMVSHVSSPPSLPSTQVNSQFPHYQAPTSSEMHESGDVTMQAGRFGHIPSARDKDKQLKIFTSAAGSSKYQPMIIASDIIFSGNYNPTSSLLNSVLIYIYELFSTQPFAHPTHSLSSWAEAKSPTPKVHPSRPFQIQPPNEAIPLNPDKPNYPIAQAIYHVNPSYSGTPASPYQLLSTPNHHNTQPIQHKPNPVHPLTPPFQLSPNPALLSINPYTRTNRKSLRSPPTTRFHPYYTRNSNPSSPHVLSVNSPDDSHHSTPLTRGWTSVNDLPFASLKKHNGPQISQSSPARFLGLVPSSIFVPHVKTAAPEISFSHSPYKSSPSLLD